jgi:uncharacterized protein (DUF1684 family)
MVRAVLCRLPLVALLALGACTSGPAPDDDSAYVAAIEQDRAGKDRDFGELPECGNSDAGCSPVPNDKRHALVPLKYYPVDPLQSVPASLKLADERPVFEMPTSTGKLRRMQLVGSLNFSINGQAMSLGAFVEDGTTQIDTLFVPFADLTTGTETYSAGRYLDLHPTSTGYYMVDFNKAYNPYCAYNSTYDCPYPPPSNRLKVAVRAGEKAPGV